MKKTISSILIIILIISTSTCSIQTKTSGNQEEYQGIMPFSEGLAGIKKSGKWGFITKEARVSIDPIYAQVKKFSNGLAAVQLTKKWGYIDRSGKTVIIHQYENAGDYMNDLCPVKKGGSWGYINIDGKTVIDFQFSDAGSFHDELAAVKTGSKWGFINTKGEYVINPLFRSAGSFSRGLAPVQFDRSDKEWGYINEKGAIIIAPQYDRTRNFASNGLAAVFIDGKWGFVDRKGKLVINPKYEGAGDFMEGLAPVQSNGRWGYIDAKGKTVIPAAFDEAGSFHNGLSLVGNNGRRFFIDLKGNKGSLLSEITMKHKSSGNMEQVYEQLLMSVVHGYNKSQSKADECVSAALVEAEKALNNYPGWEEYMMKAQILIIQKNNGGVINTLKEFDARYPGNGISSFFRGVSLSMTGGSPAEIAAHHKKAFAAGVEGMTESDFWQYMDKSDFMASFRGTPEFQDLKALKGKIKMPFKKDSAIAGFANDDKGHGYTGFKAGWKLYFYLGGDKVWIWEIIDGFLDFACEVFSDFFPPWKIVCIIQGIALWAEKIFIFKAEQEGCGVILSWYWFQIGLFTAGIVVPFGIDAQHKCERPVDPVKPHPSAPKNLTIDIDVSKPHDPDEMAVLTAEKVNYKPVEYQFEFTAENGVKHYSDWQASNVFKYRLGSYGGTPRTITVTVQARDEEYKTTSGYGPVAVTYKLFREYKCINTIKGYSYLDDHNAPWNESDFDIPLVDITCQIVVNDGTCTMPDDKTIYVFQWALNGDPKGYLTPWSESDRFLFNPIKFSKQRFALKPGDVLTFSAMSKCRNAACGTDYVTSRKFTISER